MAKCKYCGMEIRWEKSRGKWMPVDAITGDRHDCKGAPMVSKLVSNQQPIGKEQDGAMTGGEMKRFSNTLNEFSMKLKELARIADTLVGLLWILENKKGDD